MRAIPESTDVLVIGGGPAGLAAAIAARRTGLTVTLAERRTPPVDKACGEGIMPDGVRILSDLGVEIPPESSFPFTGIRYVEKSIVATGLFPGRPGIGIRRTVLHDALARRADDLGVALLWGCSFEGLTASGGRLQGRQVRARWVIGADGQNSRLRGALGLDLPPAHRRIGIRRHYAIPPWSDFVEVHWSSGCEIYVTPVTERQVCVAALIDSPAIRFDDALRRFPALRQRLNGAPAATGDLGSETVFRRSRAVVSGRVALLGDAAGSVDAITGEGVTLGLHQAVALARALEAGDLAYYARAYAGIMRLPNRMTSMMLTIHGRPALRRCVLVALSSIPPLFSQLLALHTRAHLLSRRRTVPLAGSAAGA